MKQKEALDILKMGKNVFLTGAPGSGKTFVLNTYIGYLKSRSVAIGVTASTGIAATHMGGITIHSWAGMGIKQTMTADELKGLKKKYYLKKRFAEVQVLIIDEISMLSAQQFDLVNQICQTLKKSDAPFGGLQVVVSGDFFQLPPIVDKSVQENYFVFQSKSWQDLDLWTCYLGEQHRQEDQVFSDVLHEMRKGTVSQQAVASLQARLGSQSEDDIPKLYTHNADVDRINQQRLDQIDEHPRTHYMNEDGEDVLVGILKKSCLAPAELHMKLGASVMFVKNSKAKDYVNGTLGTIVDFSESGYPIVEVRDGKKIEALPASWAIEEEGEVMAEIFQVPLRLAWAITVHKSQGMSLDAAEMDLSKCFEPGMGYVALSRVRTLKGLYLKGLNQMALKVDETVKKFDRELQKASAASQRKLAKMKKREIFKKQDQFIDSLTQYQESML